MFPNLAFALRPAAERLRPMSLPWWLHLVYFAAVDCIICCDAAILGAGRDRDGVGNAPAAHWGSGLRVSQLCVI
eukprot:1037683-Pelagomonas_calceolata.AAC.7